MPWSAISPAVSPLHPVRRDDAGLRGPTRGSAGGARWRRTSRGFYVPADVDPSVPAQRIAEAAVLLPEGGAVTGWASLRMHRASYFDGADSPVPLVVGPGHSRRSRDGVRFVQDRLEAAEIVTIQGVRCTQVRRAVFDELRLLPDVRAAAIAMDMVAAARLTSIARMRTYVAARAGSPGVGQVRAALDLADEDSWSPGESWLRLVWVLDAKRPRPLTNTPVFSIDGRLLGYADLLDPAAGVVGEYDGADHRKPARQSADEDRAGRFRAHGLEIGRFTGADQHHRERTVERIHQTYARADGPRPPRRWTLTPPEGWREDQLPLDLELDLRGEPQ